MSNTAAADAAAPLCPPLCPPLDMRLVFELVATHVVTEVDELNMPLPACRLLCNLAQTCKAGEAAGAQGIRMLGQRFNTGVPCPIAEEWCMITPDTVDKLHPTRLRMLLTAIGQEVYSDTWAKQYMKHAVTRWRPRPGTVPEGLYFEAGIRGKIRAYPARVAKDYFGLKDRDLREITRHPACIRPMYPAEAVVERARARYGTMQTLREAADSRDEAQKARDEIYAAQRKQRDEAGERLRGVLETRGWPIVNWWSRQLVLWSHIWPGLSFEVTLQDMLRRLKAEKRMYLLSGMTSQQREFCTQTQEFEQFLEREGNVREEQLTLLALCRAHRTAELIAAFDRCGMPVSEALLSDSTKAQAWICGNCLQTADQTAEAIRDLWLGPK